MKESLPLFESIDKVLNYFKEYSVSKKSALDLGKQLALSPDALLSNLGLVLVAALSNKIPKAQIIATAKRKGTYVAFLRRAAKKVREFYGHNQDWIEQGLVSDYLIEQYLVEKSMNFIPWLTFSLERLNDDIKKKSLPEIISKICEYDFESALKLCEQLLKEDPEDTEVAIQKIYLLLQLGNLEEIDKPLKSLMTAPKADQMLNYYNLLGKISMAKKDFSRAYNYYKAGLGIKSKDLMLISDMQNDAAWCCMLLEKRGQALVHLEKALLTTTCPVTILLNKSSVLWEIGDAQRAFNIRKELFQTSPYDRRVFSNLTLEAPVNN